MHDMEPVSEDGHEYLPPLPPLDASAGALITFTRMNPRMYVAKVGPVVLGRVEYRPSSKMPFICMLDPQLSNSAPVRAETFISLRVALMTLPEVQAIVREVGR